MSKIKMVHKCYWFLCVYTDLFCFFFGVKGYKTEDFSVQYQVNQGWVDADEDCATGDDEDLRLTEIRKR